VCWAATNQDPEALVREEISRRSLLPAQRGCPSTLRAALAAERTEDVSTPGRAFSGIGLPSHGQEREVLRGCPGGRLQLYDWPGNVRELENMVERLVIPQRERHRSASPICQHQVRTHRRAWLQWHAAGHWHAGRSHRSRRHPLSRIEATLIARRQ